MIACRTMCVAVVLVVALTSRGALARSSEGLARMEKLFSSDTSLSSSAPLDAAADHSLSKRAVFDQSCKGVYDRSLFKKLEMVCDDCYNLYRKPYVATGCREKCFARDVFPLCVESLGLDLDLYLAIRAMLQ